MARKHITPLPNPAIATGTKVFLRHPTGGDRAEWVKLRDQSELHLWPWEPTPPGMDEPFSSDVAFGNLLGSCDDARSQRFLICLRSSRAIAGQVSLNNIIRGAFQSTSVGYWIGAAFARRGLMSEGLSLAITHALGPLGLHRVEANIIPANVASLTLVRKLGLRYEGTAKDYLRIAGRWQDHERWAVTAPEWQAVTSPPGSGGRVRPSASAARRGGSSKPR